MTNAELREFCTQMIGKFKLLSDIQKEMQYETIDAKFTEWELKKLIFALNVLREEVRKYVDTADTPQTDCETCKHYKLACELFSEICKYEPTTQTETQNSNLTFEKRTMRDCYNCKRYETEGECIECHYEPKTEPQTERSE